MIKSFTSAPASTRVAIGEEHSKDAPLTIHDMTVAYHRRPVLWDVDFDAPEGKLIGIIGPNGAGKSTLIKAAMGLVPKVSGRVLFYGQPYERQRKLVGYVPQRETVDWDFPVNALDVVAIHAGRRANEHAVQGQLGALGQLGAVVTFEAILLPGSSW